MVAPRLKELDLPTLQVMMHSSVAEGKDGIRDVIKACLREIMWCKLKSVDGRFYLHFGYDYYMFIGGEFSFEEVRDIAKKNGLYAEEYISPYLG